MGHLMALNVPQNVYLWEVLKNDHYIVNKLNTSVRFSGKYRSSKTLEGFFLK